VILPISASQCFPLGFLTGLTEFNVNCFTISPNFFWLDVAVYLFRFVVAVSIWQFPEALNHIIIFGSKFQNIGKMEEISEMFGKFYLSSHKLTRFRRLHDLAGTTRSPAGCLCGQHLILKTRMLLLAIKRIPNKLHFRCPAVVCFQFC